MPGRACARSGLLAIGLTMLGVADGRPQTIGQQPRVVAAGQWVRFDTAATSSNAVRRVAGKFLSADSGSIYLDPAGRQSYLAVSRTSLRNLEARTRQGHAVGGLLVGALVGAGTAVLLSATPAEGECEGCALLVAPLFAGAGAVLGAVLGNAVRGETWAPAQIPAPGSS